MGCEIRDLDYGACLQILRRNANWQDEPAGNVCRREHQIVTTKGGTSPDVRSCNISSHKFCLFASITVFLDRQQYKLVQPVLSRRIREVMSMIISAVLLGNDGGASTCISPNTSTEPSLFSMIEQALCCIHHSETTMNVLSPGTANLILPAPILQSI